MGPWSLSPPLFWPHRRRATAVQPMVAIRSGKRQVPFMIDCTPVHNSAQEDHVESFSHCRRRDCRRGAVASDT
jgi:hypothetical protein